MYSLSRFSFLTHLLVQEEAPSKVFGVPLSHLRKTGQMRQGLPLAFTHLVGFIEKHGECWLGVWQCFQVFVMDAETVFVKYVFRPQYQRPVQGWWHSIAPVWTEEMFWSRRLPKAEHWGCSFLSLRLKTFPQHSSWWSHSRAIHDRTAGSVQE